jgi:hypothetical protein
MGLTAWFGPRGVFSSGEAAHIFGSGSVLLDMDVLNSLQRMWKEEEGGALRTWQPGAKITIPGIDNIWTVHSKNH